MASSTLRQTVFALFTGDAELTALGFTDTNIFPNFSPDAPAGDRFAVIRWGVTNLGIGAVNKVTVGCWVYNRQPDFGIIANALLRIRRLLPTLEAVRMSPTEAILGVDYGGDSDDLYDDGYRAYTRWTSHTITASGS